MPILSIPLLRSHLRSSGQRSSIGNSFSLIPCHIVAMGLQWIEVKGKGIIRFYSLLSIYALKLFEIIYWEFSPGVVFSDRIRMLYWRPSNEAGRAIVLWDMVIDTTLGYSLSWKHLLPIYIDHAELGSYEPNSENLMGAVSQGKNNNILSEAQVGSLSI